VSIYPNKSLICDRPDPLQTKRTTACKFALFMSIPEPGLPRTSTVAGRFLEHLPQAILVAITTVLIVLLYHPVLQDLAHDWWTEPQLSQGMLLPPLALYIAWLRKGVTLSCVSRVDLSGLLVSGLACCIFTIGTLAAEFFLMRMSFVVLLAGVVVTAWGWPRFLSLAMPFALLVALIPLPSIVYSRLSVPLQLLSSRIATTGLEWIGVVAHREGNYIHLGTGTLGVEEACNGLGAISALTVAGILLGFMLCSRPVSRVALALTAIPLAIAINVIRIVATGILAEWNVQFAMGLYHAVSGWLVFVFGFGIVFVMAKFVRTVEARV
jgi:exosortase